jgi:hypothetical protein
MKLYLNCQLGQAAQEWIAGKQKIFYCDRVQNLVDYLIECRLIT